FYAVERLDPIVDWSFMTPRLFGVQVGCRGGPPGCPNLTVRLLQLRSWSERLQLALDLLDFLRRFVQLRPKSELCDLKHSHFGYRETEAGSRELALLDGDMVLNRRSLSL